MKYFTFAIITLFLVGCKTYSEEDKSKFDQKIEKFIAKSDIKYERSESGLYYYIENVGDGEFIKFNDEVSFTYTGKLLSGKTFDGLHKRTPVRFEVSKLIEGWKEAFMYLKKGGKVKLIIPPTLGYGDHDLPDYIPPHSILVFDIEIIDVH
jgi:FKBP-type peptidyl-prolyl cis-trans isomerase FkpA